MPKVAILPVVKDSDGWYISLRITEFLDVIRHLVIPKRANVLETESISILR
jgi:hypothetical protein